MGKSELKCDISAPKDEWEVLFKETEDGHFTSILESRRFDFNVYIPVSTTAIRK